MKKLRSWKLPKVKKAANGKAGTWAQIIWLLNLCSNHQHNVDVSCYKAEPSLSFQQNRVSSNGCGPFFPFIKSTLKNVCTNVYSSFVHNCSKLEVTFRDVWINYLWYVQTMDCYSVLKRNGLLSHEKPRRNLKSVLLSERSQSEKAIYCMAPTIRRSGKHKTMEK